MTKIKLNKKEIKEIEIFLKNRFRILDDLRSEFDDDIEEEVDLYNDIDKFIEDKGDWEEKITVPYIYTIVQTMVARLIQTLFGDDNYIKVFVEDESMSNLEKALQLWVQGVLDVMRLKSRSRDFLEESLVQRTIWLHPRPILDGTKFKGVDFDIIKWFDIWFDTTVAKVEDTDFFIRKIQKLHKVEENKSHYFNLEKVYGTEPPQDIKDKEKEVYQAKHGVSKYYETDRPDQMKEIELLEYYGVYKIDGKYKEIVFTLANREVLIRADTNELKTRQKKLFFPIRPLRQANSLIGKSVPQLIKSQQYELNEVESLRLQNFKTQIRLLFKYRRDSGIDFDELFVKGGNAIGYDDNKDDIDMFNVPNLIQFASFMRSEIIQDMQQVTGAVDMLMGTSSARGITETASGIKQITEQALFKFGMMATNIHDDLLNFINFIIIIWMKYGKDEIIIKKPELADFFNQSEEEIENSYAIDIAMQDLAMKREIERSQFINAINIIAGLLAQTGGNVKELLKQVMQRFNMQNIDKILETPKQEGGGGLGDLLAQQAQERGGSTKASPQAEVEATPEETAFGVTPERL